MKRAQAAAEEMQIQQQAMTEDYQQQERIVNLLCSENDELKRKLCEATGCVANRTHTTTCYRPYHIHMCVCFWLGPDELHVLLGI
jgi:hypothetical protein